MMMEMCSDTKSSRDTLIISFSKVVSGFFSYASATHVAITRSHRFSFNWHTPHAIRGYTCCRSRWTRPSLAVNSVSSTMVFGIFMLVISPWQRLYSDMRSIVAGISLSWQGRELSTEVVAYTSAGNTAYYCKANRELGGDKTGQGQAHWHVVLGFGEVFQFLDG